MSWKRRGGRELGCSTQFQTISVPPSLRSGCVTCLPWPGRLRDSHAWHHGRAGAVACSLLRPFVLCWDIEAFFASSRNEGTGNSCCLPTPLSYLTIWSGVLKHLGTLNSVLWIGGRGRHSFLRLKGLWNRVRVLWSSLHMVESSSELG